MRRRRHERQSGAIMVEALIVIALLITSLQCIWMLYQFCLVQHRAQLEARASAWETALTGCGESKLSGVLSALSKSDDGKHVSDLRETGDSAPNWVKVESANEGTVDVDLPAPLLGKSRVSASQNFACNEKGNHKPLQLLGGGDPSADALGASAPENTSE